MEASTAFTIATAGAGAGYLIGYVHAWRLARRLEKLNIKPSVWQGPLDEPVTDTIGDLMRNITQ